MAEYQPDINLPLRGICIMPLLIRANVSADDSTLKNCISGSIHGEYQPDINASTTGSIRLVNSHHLATPGAPPKDSHGGSPEQHVAGYLYYAVVQNA